MCDIKINNYNSAIFKLHRANMDIQFNLDPYGFVKYILNYLNKAERGMYKLLKDAVEEVKSGNYSIRDKLKIVDDRYLNATEVSAQEAVYQLSLHRPPHLLNPAHFCESNPHQIPRPTNISSSK